MSTDDLVVGPTLNAALVRVVYPSGELGPKASGTLVAIADDFYLFSNWHVATGRKWKTPVERAAWKEKHGSATDWMSASDCFTPWALRVSIYAMGAQRVLTQVEIECSPAHDLAAAFAWDSDDEIVHRDLDMPEHDVVCVHLGEGVQELAGRLSAVAGKRVRVGYDYWQTGLDYGASVGDRIFVVGFPQDIGTRVTDPPVWTGGTIATDPYTDWEGARYLIDARTRSGQSGAAVIAYAPASGGLPSQAQLLGLYSGRIDEKADIGSVWRLDGFVEDIATGRRRPRAAVRTADLAVETLLT